VVKYLCILERPYKVYPLFPGTGTFLGGVLSVLLICVSARRVSHKRQRLEAFNQGDGSGTRLTSCVTCCLRPGGLAHHRYVPGIQWELIGTGQGGQEQLY